MTIHHTGATTSRFGPTIWRSRMRCPRWRNGSGRWGRPRRRFSRKTAGRNASRSLDLGRIADHRIVALVLELVDTRRRSAARRILSILAPVPLLRVQVVVRRAGLQDIEEGVSFVLDPRLDRGDEMLDIVRVAAADPRRARREGEPDRVDGLVDVRMGEG